MKPIVKCIDCPDYKVTVYSNLRSVSHCEKRHFVTDADKSCDWWDGYLKARELYLEGAKEKVVE